MKRNEDRNSSFRLLYILSDNHTKRFRSRNYLLNEFVEREKRVDGWRMCSKPKVIRAHAFFVADISYCLMARNETFDRITFTILSVYFHLLSFPIYIGKKIICMKKRRDPLFCEKILISHTHDSECKIIVFLVFIYLCWLGGI